jgi:Transposase DDE domain
MSTTRPSRKQTKKRSTVRHTRAIQRDRTKRPLSMPLDEQFSQHLTQIIHPATLAQVAHYHQLGLRERLLSLPVMVALVLTLLWRQLPSVGELVRLLRCEGFLWCSPVQVSQQALSERLRTFPAELFLRVLQDLLPPMQARAQARKRPLPPALAWAVQHYAQVLAVDGSTLDALLRKVGLLRDLPKNPLAGRMTALLDLCSRLPHQIWYEADPQAHDQRFWPRIQGALRPGTLLLFDLGYTNFGIFAQLSAAQVTWLTRAKSNLAYTRERWLVHTDSVQDALVWIGSGAERQQVRLVAVRVGRTWYRYLTNALDAVVLPAPYVAALYAQRWRIEEAYALVKRLLGLAYFFVGSENGVQLQLFATWLLYAVLVDLTDAVAESLDAPLAALSLEMVYRSLYYFSQAFHRGEAEEPVRYLAQNAKWLGILKRTRKRDGPKLPALPLLTNLAGA